MWVSVTLIACLIISLSKEYNSAEIQRCGANSSCTPKWKCAEFTSNIYGKGQIDFRISSNACLRYLVCCENEYILVDPKSSSPANNNCGMRPIDEGNKLIPKADSTKEDTHFAEFPWVVAIFVNSSENLEYVGGGSLLAPNVVLTAAHLVYGKAIDILVVRAGEWDIKSEAEQFKHEDRDVVEVIVHDSFNPNNSWYNIAIVVLKTPLAFSSHINPLCLVRPHEFPVSSRCFVAGWGKDKPEDRETQRVLRKIDLPIVDHEECQQKLRKTRLGANFQLHESFLCAGGEEDLDACTGDGGSPLFCPLNDHADRYFLQGIVNWGLSCNVNDVPGVYANVSFFNLWIREVLKTLEIDVNHHMPPSSSLYIKRKAERIGRKKN